MLLTSSESTVVIGTDATRWPFLLAMMSISVSYSKRLAPLRTSGMTSRCSMRNPHCVSGICCPQTRLILPLIYRFTIRRTSGIALMSFMREPMKIFAFDSDAIRERSRSITNERRDENRPHGRSCARADLRRHVRILFCVQFRRRIRIEQARYIQPPADAAESDEDIGPW